MHQVCTGETMGPAEKLDVLRLHVRAVPHAGARGGGAAEEELIVDEEALWLAAEEEGKAGERGRGCACSAAPLLPAYL